jgi:hypothetical protein
MTFGPSISEVISTMERLGYVWFDDPNQKGYDLNIVGLRTSDTRSNLFNDWIMVFYRTYAGTYTFMQIPCTTDPGLFYRNNPENINGTAILKPGQYRGAYKLGKHKGYDALQQKNPMVVYRDNDHDNFLDTNRPVQRGVFGINIHRANPDRTSVLVDKWSAGCQVIADPTSYTWLIDICKKAVKTQGNSFTYTLLTEQQLQA